MTHQEPTEKQVLAHMRQMHEHLKQIIAVTQVAVQNRAERRKRRKKCK
jgi:hypothetical protein